jgi:hypothetical protein
MKPVRILLALCLTLAAAAGVSAAPGGSGRIPPDPYVLVVQRVSGDARAALPGAPDTAAVLQAGDLPDSGGVFRTGRDGLLVLRFHPDLMTLEARGRARLGVGYAATDAGGARRIDLFEGRILAGLSRQGPGLQARDAHSLLRAGAGRISFGTDARASVIFVMEGEAEVRNLATGAVKIVGRGEKAVSDARGLRVTRARAGELAGAGLGQNVLEVDFWNPVTGDFRTLEVKYEKSP